MLLSRSAALLVALALFLTLWGFVPPPTYGLLVLSVGAPEVGVWIGSVALLGGALAWAGARGRLRWATLCCAGVTIVLSLLPLLRFAGTRRQFDAAMDANLGHDYLATVPDTVRQRLRPASLRWGELFTGLQSDSVGVFRDTIIGSAEGVALHAAIYQPTLAGTWPVVVQIYGGAWQRGAPADDAAFAQYLASRGYLVVAIDYRHAPRWQWPAQLGDVRRALDWVRAHAADFHGDATRLVVIGRSSGAQLALVAAYSDSLPVRAVVSFYGPVDLVDGYTHPPVPDPLDVRSLETAYLGGTPSEQPARYAAASPVSYTNRPQPPTLLIYAGRDNVVLPRFGRLLRDRLQAGGTTVVLLEIPWAQHAFDKVSGGPSAQLALIAVERFLAWATSGAGGRTGQPRVLHAGVGR